MRKLMQKCWDQQLFSCFRQKICNRKPEYVSTHQHLHELVRWGTREIWGTVFFLFCFFFFTHRHWLETAVFGPKPLLPCSDHRKAAGNWTFFSLHQVFFPRPSCSSGTSLGQPEARFKKVVQGPQQDLYFAYHNQLLQTFFFVVSFFYRSS